ncbi:C-GCAxxG-C-C family (seleno)protein [Desulfoluna butyratoxydans]|uniref:C-GCAxxG-C-C family (seleno)protein n=1 Tax=Desulfoluna butyratoxydans TaxID=231438 RepID=UPI003CCDCDCA
MLAEVFEIPLDEQVISSAIGLPGAAKHGALCGLVSGTLMFIGIWGRKHSIPDSEISDQCNRFSTAFEKRFASLQCSVLRPEGFHPDNPPHLCGPITCQALELSIQFLTNVIL